MILIRMARISLMLGAVLFGSQAIAVTNAHARVAVPASADGEGALRSSADAIGQLLSSTASTRTARSHGVQAAAGDLTIKDAIGLARRGKTSAAADWRDRIHDAAGASLVEWVALRTGDVGDDAMSFSRYAAFARAHPSWPSHNVFRRRAEFRLWIERSEPSVVFAFFSTEKPLGAHGQLAMARALLANGKRGAAQTYARAAWRQGDLSAPLEAQVLATFGPLLTKADHAARLTARLLADDLDAAMRAARRLGAAEVAIVNARTAVDRKAANAQARLDAVPMAARADPAYVFTRIQWLRRSERAVEAARLMLSVPRDPAVIHDPDTWWIERRILVRQLLDEREVRLAYRIASEAVPPSREALRVDQPFTAGWIALRFLNDPQAAAQHFTRIPQITAHPTSLARAGYWLGRAAEAGGRKREAHRYYEAAARHSAAYYGQLASARLGHRKIAIRQPPELSHVRRAALRKNDLVRAVELLYATGNRDLVIPFVADLDRVSDIGVVTLIAETAAEHKDARAMLTLGKGALARGVALDPFAFPRFGLPNYVPIGPKAAPSLVYAVARAESGFNAEVVSAARAQGFMQVTPEAGRTIARRLGVSFEPKRLLSDPAYNMQLGSAEIADLVNTYDGNYVLAFVGYNAGRGRAKQWIARYGDPRDPDVDAVDWVERIPFTETRIYVQRVIENLQIYRSRFSQSARLTIEVDMRGSTPR